MKSYREFMDYVKENVTEYLPERFENTEIRIQQVVKNNDTVLDGLIIMNPDTHISPNIYLNSLYEEYKDGKDLDDLVSRVADIYIENMEPQTKYGMNVQIGEISQYEKVRNNIFPRVCNLEKNGKRLENVPYTPKEDLAITYHIRVASGEDGIGSVMITNALMKQYGVGIEELHDTAMNNMEQLSPVKFSPLRDVIVELMAGDFAQSEGISTEEAKEFLKDTIPSEGPEVYCLTNEENMNGAAYIMNENVQKMVAEKVGDEYFILPSSVHEVLIISKKDGMNVDELREMVKSVNGSCVSVEEILSDQVYRYDAKTHTLSICSPEKELKQEQTMGKNLQPAMVMEESNQYEIKQPEQNHEPMKHSVRGH